MLYFMRPTACTSPGRGGRIGCRSGGPAAGSPFIDSYIQQAEPVADYLTAQRIRNQLRREADEIVSHYDAVIAPTWPNGAALREVSQGWPIPARNEWEPPNDLSARTPRLNYIANLVGHPGLAIPCGFDEDGLPLSLQIVGSAFDEQAVLDFGMGFQRETDWHLRRPQYPWRE